MSSETGDFTQLNYPLGNTYESNGCIQVAYPLDAVPYSLFAKMIDRKPSAVKGMIEKKKLPLVEFRAPNGAINGRSDAWVYIPAFNEGMRRAYLEQSEERRNAWLLWVGL